MSACRHRPEEGCVFTACSSAFPSRRCLCADEIKADIEAATAVEVRAARVPDSARSHDFAVHLPGERDDCPGCVEGDSAREESA